MACFLEYDGEKTFQSYKKEFRLRDSPPAAGRASDIFHSAAVRSPGGFYTIGKELSYRIKNRLATLYAGTQAAGFLHTYSLWCSTNPPVICTALSGNASFAQAFSGFISVRHSGRPFMLSVYPILFLKTSCFYGKITNTGFSAGNPGPHGADRPPYYSLCPSSARCTSPSARISSACSCVI